MIYALDNEENVLYVFQSERAASEFCHKSGSYKSWRLWDETGKALIPLGFAPAAPIGLFALQGLVEHLHAQVVNLDHGASGADHAITHGDEGSPLGLLGFMHG